MQRILTELGIFTPQNYQTLCKPQGKRHVGEFWIMRYPVTNAFYVRFATQHPGLNWAMPVGKDDHPAVNMTWQEANQFAAWAGCELPTVAEWEKAARGTKDVRAYPWGDQFDPQRCVCHESGARGTSPVGQHPGGDSPFGVGDLVGNVREWTKDCDANGFPSCKGGAFDMTCRVYGLIHFTIWVEGGAPDTDCGFRLVTHTHPRRLPQLPGIVHQVVR